jgi:hypothetical protein
MSNPKPELRAREILKRIANENSYETWADFVCDSNDQFLTDYTVKAMLEFATPAGEWKEEFQTWATEEMPNLIKKRGMKYSAGAIGILCAEWYENKLSSLQKQIEELREEKQRLSNQFDVYKSRSEQVVEQLKEERDEYHRNYRNACDIGSKHVQTIIELQSQLSSQAGAVDAVGLKPADLIPLPETWVNGDFKAAWERDNAGPHLSDKERKEAWKRTIRVVDMIYQYQVKAKQNQLFIHQSNIK